MSKRLLIAGGFVLASLMALAPATPVLAQGNSADKVLVVFGSDACPTGTICVRKGESERFRIPKELREVAPSTHNERWADRAKSIDSINAQAAGGTGSCSTVGGGGWTGCWAKDMQAAKAEKQAEKENPQD